MHQVLILLFFATAWSAEEQDFEYSGFETSKYIFYYPVFNRLESTVEVTSAILNDIYLCSHDFRSNNLPNSDNLNFDELATTYAKCYWQAIFYKEMEPTWIELYGKRSELKLQRLSGLQVHLAMNDVTFSKGNAIAENVELSLRNVIDNSRSGEETTMKVEHAVEKTTTATLSSAHSWSYSSSLEVGFKEPITDSGATVRMSMFAGGTSESSSSYSDTVTYTLSDFTTIPAHKVGRLIWTKSETEAAMDWTAYIEASGWVAVGAENSIAFFPVVDMAYAFSEYVTKLDVNTIGLKVSGKLKMSDSVVSDAVIDEFDLSKSSSKCPNQLRNFTATKSLVS